MDKLRAELSWLWGCFASSFLLFAAGCGGGGTGQSGLDGARAPYIFSSDTVDCEAAIEISDPSNPFPAGSDWTVEFVSVSGSGVSNGSTYTNNNNQVEGGVLHTFVPTGVPTGTYAVYVQPTTGISELAGYIGYDGSNCNGAGAR